MNKIGYGLVLTLLVLLNSPGASASRPVIMLTGYWPPTNEMLRPFSQDPTKNNGRWIGANWRNRGYDIEAFFPEFPPGSGDVGTGDFQVEWNATQRDFTRITSILHPIAIVSFGKGDGPWELEVNAPDYQGHEPTFKNSLPFFAIAAGVNSYAGLRAWIDGKGDAGNYLCGFLSHLGASYHVRHSNPADPYWNIAQGFIHVAPGYPPDFYERAVSTTLNALIMDLDNKRRRVISR